ncbi:hypothetical protein IJG79_02370 [Candidatus Saccharibacteria bacterium]|nr:hypothetical protein [Candidatus Saccharibacteria bacterium]
MEHIFTFFAAPTNTLIKEVNPLDANVIFKIGFPILIIILVFLVLCALIGFFARVGGMTRLDIETGKWTSRFVLIFIYSVLTWLSLSMLIGYLGNGILDVVNGALLFVGMTTSIIQRATGNQPGANRSLAFTFGFLAVMIVWNFIYGAVMDALPAEFMDTIGSEFHADFFNDLLKYIGWMK